MAADLKDRLMQRIAATMTPENLSQIGSFSLESLKQQAETAQWHPYALASHAKRFWILDFGF